MPSTISNNELILNESYKYVIEEIWQLLFPKNGDGIIDNFHKKDLVKKCPLYSIVWQDDDYVVGHRFTTIMELNGFSKEIKNLHTYQPIIFNKLVHIFKLKDAILVDENSDKDFIYSSSSTSDFI